MNADGLCGQRAATPGNLVACSAEAVLALLAVLGSQTLWLAGATRRLIVLALLVAAALILSLLAQAPPGLLQLAFFLAYATTGLTITSAT
ncbi:MAG: hypothetical protein ACM3JC_06965 [Rudaea sp.]